MHVPSTSLVGDSFWGMVRVPENFAFFFFNLQKKLDSLCQVQANFLLVVESKDGKSSQFLFLFCLLFPHCLQNFNLVFQHILTKENDVLV